MVLRSWAQWQRASSSTSYGAFALRRAAQQMGHATTTTPYRSFERTTGGAFEIGFGTTDLDWLYRSFPPTVIPTKMMIDPFHSFPFHDSEPTINQNDYERV